LKGLCYILVVPLAYLLAGSLKFLVNSLISRRPAFDQIGLGRFPSTHSAIVAAPCWLIGLQGQARTPVFAVALAVALIVIIDAMDLRRHLEKVNVVLRASHPDHAGQLRARVAHKPIEVLGGIVVGGIAAWVASLAG
jgi:acid phosphatase family membrane protein YuiD